MVKIVSAPHTIHLTQSIANLEPPAGQLRFTNPATVNFTTNLVAAVAKMFPSKYFSTGGDELNEACYTADQETQQQLNSTGQTLEQALSNFTVSTHSALMAQGKTPVVWEGLLFDLFGRKSKLMYSSCRDGPYAQCHAVQ